MTDIEQQNAALSNNHVCVTLVLGHDEVGVIAQACETDGMYYLTPCCGASAKGMSNYVGCRSCYQPVDPRLGDVPNEVLRIDILAEGAERFRFEPRPGWEFTDVYGDGIPYDEWYEKVMS